MEEAPENGKESSHSAHAKGLNEIIIHVFEILLHLFSNHDQHKWETAEITTLNHTGFNCWTQGEANKVCHLATKHLHHHHHSHYLTDRHMPNIVSVQASYCYCTFKKHHTIFATFFFLRNKHSKNSVRQEQECWLTQNNTSRNNTSHIITYHL